MAPALGEAVRSVAGGLAVLPIMSHALKQGDELHSRNTASSLLFLRELAPALFDLEAERRSELWSYLISGDYFFLRISMAAAKAMADRMKAVAGPASIVTAMAFSSQECRPRIRNGPSSD